jgi:hypothetical protein
MAPGRRLQGCTRRADRPRLRQQPGFISRELVHDAEGDRWVDVIWWETLEQAQAASERSMTSESCSPMFALIDLESALMLHGTPAINAVRATTPARA